MGDAGFLLAPVILISIIGIRVMLHFSDKSKIESAAREKGWENVAVTWSPFAPGWFFEKNERHYLVTYVDTDGYQRQRYCKTSIFTGIYWRDESN